MTVRQLTLAQKDSLVGAEFTSNSLFNPIEDSNGVWVITEEEVECCTDMNCCWVKELPSIEYSPKIYKITWPT